MRREICNLAIGDLPAIIGAKAFMVNKIETAIDSVLAECLREIVYE